MIKVCAAILSVDDTFVVKHNISIGLDWYTNWLLVNSSLQLGHAPVWDMTVAWNLNLLLFDSSFATLVLSSIWIVSFELNTVIFGVIESVSFKTSIASLVSFGNWAINKLLLRKLEEGSSLNKVLSLHCCNSWEGPAWSTVFLILNWIKSSLGSPVNVVGEIWSWELNS
jgi:hypothetical protein